MTELGKTGVADIDSSQTTEVEARIFKFPLEERIINMKAGGEKLVKQDLAIKREA